MLFYGHYDVQPVDPLNEWTSQPFKAEVHGDRIYARGAEDNKGQIWYVIKALEALIKADSLGCSVVLLLEGEEESASVGLTESLPALQPRIKSDVLMACDSSALRPGIPCVTMGLRGIIFIEFRICGLKGDLHSGEFGGMIKNPAVELCRLISTFHNPDGSIAVAGYYDQVAKPAEEDLRLVKRTSFDEAAFTEVTGVPASGGEQNYTPYERVGMRPTIEVNGMRSGYGGPGSKTIIPAEASVKITSRLVAGQDPEKCLQLLEAHIRKHAPKDLKFEIVDKGVGGPALSLSAQSPVLEKAREVLELLGGGKTDFSWIGGSIPVIPEMLKYTGGEPLLVGFGLADDKIHSPNESFSLEQFKLGYLYACMMFQKLSER